MDVAAAVLLAKKYTKPRDDKFAFIRFAAGIVYAQTEGAGIVVACPDVAFEASVDGAQLFQMVKKAGAKATFKLERTTLVVSGEGGDYRLQGLDAKAADKLPSPPETPRRFPELDEAGFKLLVTVAGLALAGDDDVSLASVRITPSWVASSRGNGLAVAWFVDAAGASLDIVREPTTIDAKFFAGLRGPMGIGMSKAFFWLQAGDVKRWTRRLEVPWPDSSVSGDNLTRLRSGGDNRKATAIDASAVRGLFDRAFAAADSRADAYRLAWGPQLALAGGGQRGKFTGAVDVPVDGGGKTFGVAPAVWLRYLDALAACCDEPVYMSIAGPTDPVALWGLVPRALEVFIWPEYIPPAV